MTKLWCAKIQLTTKQRTYRFSNDLQLALNQTAHPQQILQALIVVPLAPTLISNNHRWQLARFRRFIKWLGLKPEACQLREVN